MEIINLDMTPSTVTPNAHAGQYDSARTVRFMLKNGGVPFTLAGTETITAEITRSDNTEVTVNVTNTSSNYVDVVFDDTVCTVKGLYACELRLKDSDGFDIGSKNFALLVQRDPYDGQGVSVETVGPADICTFETTLAEPLQSVLVNVEATGGNGTPESPNPINGYTQANVVNVNNSELATTLKKVFGGTYGFVDLGTLTWTKDTTTVPGKIIFRAQLTNAKNGFDCLCPNYPYKGSYSNLVDKSCAYIYNTRIAIQDSTYDSATADEFKTAMSGKYLLYELDIATTPTITESVFNAIVLSFNANGTMHTIAFGQTVYGGVLDVTRGKLHVTHTYIKGGFEQYNASNGYKAYRRYNCPKSKSTYTGGISNMVSEFGSFNSDNMTKNIIQLPYGLGNCFMALDENANPNDVEIVYELATPFDIDLTPEVISAIVGENNVFADCGQTTVKYLKAGE